MQFDRNDVLGNVSDSVVYCNLGNRTRIVVLSEKTIIVFTGTVVVIGYAKITIEFVVFDVSV